MSDVPASSRSTPGNGAAAPFGQAGAVPTSAAASGDPPSFGRLKAQPLRTFFPDEARDLLVLCDLALRGLGEDTGRHIDAGPAATKARNDACHLIRRDAALQSYALRLA